MGLQLKAPSLWQRIRENIHHRPFLQADTMQEIALLKNMIHGLGVLALALGELDVELGLLRNCQGSGIDGRGRGLPSLMIGPPELGAAREESHVEAPALQDADQRGILRQERSWTHQFQTCQPVT
jgi:hypothetical protein